MPASDADSPRHNSGATANEAGLVALGSAIDARQPRAAHRRHRARRTRSRRRTWIRRSIITLSVVVVLLIAAVVADYYYLGSLVNKISVGHIQDPSGPAVNILAVGSTDRCLLKVQNPMYGTCAENAGDNSDIIMILHLDPSTHKVSLLSIPRDLFVPNDRQPPWGPNKIDAALYQGPSQVVDAIEEDFGIPINHYVELNFDTFADVVNELGGVKMYFPDPIFDAESSLNIERKGCYDLNGLEALELVRARHLQYQVDPNNHDPRSWPQEAQSDLARILRTHEFLRVLATKVAQRGLGNPFADQALAQKVLPDLTVDDGFSEGEMVSLAENFASTNINNVPQYTYPVLVVYSPSVSGYEYQGYYYGDVEFPVEPGGQQAIDTIFDVARNANPFTNRPLPAPASFPIAVDDGTDDPSATATVAAQLRTKGFDVAATGSMTPVGPTAETVVWYGGSPPPKSGNWTSPSLADAERVLQQLQGPAILGYGPQYVAAGSRVTIETGTDLTVRPGPADTPPPTTTTTLKKSSTSSTTKGTSGVTTTTAVTATTVYDPPGVSNNNGFSAPSPLSEPLTWYDPRPCNAAGTGPG